MTEHVSLIRYEAARAALEEAVRVDEVQQVRNVGLQMRAYAKIAKDKKLQADAAALIIRAERKLGVLIQSAKETGQLGLGRPAKSNVLGPQPSDDDGDGEENGYEAQPFTRTTLAEAGIDKQLSMRAQNWARLGAEEFDAKLREVRDKIESTGAAIVNPQKDLSTADKKGKRRQREIDLADKQRGLPSKVYGVIYADPEWRFEVRSEGGLDRSADNHYTTSSLDEIKARPVASIAADDCVLFLWATAPMLPHALEVMDAWGFTYKSHTIWRKAEKTTVSDPARAVQSAAKLVLGTGYWFRNGHELLLVGTRGELPAPAMGDQWASVLDEAPRKHSQKPDWAYELIEAYFPNLPKIELNARQRREGWDAWGLEAPETETIPQGEPGDRASGGPKTAAGPSQVAAGPGEGTEAAGQGDTGQEVVLPHADVPVFLLTTQQKNAIIRAGYGQNVPLDRLAAATGLKKDAVKQRARVMKLGSRDRQRSMASAFATAQHQKRREGQQA